MHWHIKIFYSELIFLQHKSDNFGKHTEPGTSLFPITEYSVWWRFIWVVKLHGLICGYHCVRGRYCLHLQDRSVLCSASTLLQDHRCNNCEDGSAV